MLANTQVNFELIIVDNNSQDGSREWLEQVAAKQYNFLRVIALEENKGGEAINEALPYCRHRFIFISENDLEFLPGWDYEMILPFYIFKKLGQLSPFSPFPQKELAEIWIDKPYKEIRFYANQKIYTILDKGNVGTSCMVRREIFERIKWHNRTDNKAGTRFKFPDDGRFSQDLLKNGYEVAWSEKYRVINWGHNIHIWKEDTNYYKDNYQSKPTVGLEELRKRLEKQGYDKDIL